MFCLAFAESDRSLNTILLIHGSYVLILKPLMREKPMMDMISCPFIYCVIPAGKLFEEEDGEH